MGLLAKIKTLKRRAGRTPKGLLKKSIESLHEVGDEETALPSEPDEVWSDSSETAGLLRIAQLRSKSSATEPIQETPEEPIGDFAASDAEADKSATRLGRLSNGFDSITSFFRILHDRFGFSKGTLLVTVFNKVELMPCAVTGFDEESIRLLQIDPKDVPPLLTDTSSDCFSVLSASKLDGVRNLFSDQDFDEFNELLLAPVYSNGNPISLLILSDISENQLKEMQDALGEDYSSIVQARYSAIEDMGEHRIKPADELDKNLELVRESTKTGLTPHLYKVSFRPAIESIVAENSLINADWLKTDILQIIGSLLGNLGNLYVLADMSVLLVVQHATELDDQLVAHQTSASLRIFFSDTEAPLFVEVEDQTVESLSADSVK